MGIIHSQISFKNISETPWLSSRPFTCNYIEKELPHFLSTQLKGNYDLLGNKNFAIRSGEYIAENYYTEDKTNYIYLSVRNFSGFKMDLINSNFLEDNEGEKYKSIALENEDIIITRSATVGCVNIFENADKKIVYIPSHHLSVLRSKDDLVFKKYCAYWLRTKYCREFFEAYATGKIQKELNNWSIRKIPIPIISNFSNIVTYCDTIYNEIYKKVDQLLPLQRIIENVFLCNKIKKPFVNSLLEMSTTTFSNINKQFFQRCSPRYRAFWDLHGGLLFEDVRGNIPIVRLSNLMKPLKTKLLKKGNLEDDYILIELDDIEERTGRVINDNRIVNEIGSDKVCFEESDLITSKLRPYLGYTILNDFAEKNYIGTTELIPFKVNKDDVRPKYLKYLLLSYEYLAKSELLMYGKEHQRIHQVDLLNIKVPCPDIKLQDIIISSIMDKENRNRDFLDQIENLKMELDNVYMAYINKKEVRSI